METDDLPLLWRNAETEIPFRIQRFAHGRRIHKDSSIVLLRFGPSPRLVTLEDFDVDDIRAATNWAVFDKLLL